jgi:tRNA 2-thiouridine synthesizing protein A
MHALPPADETLDCAGLLCPLPVLRAAKRLRAMPEGAVLAVLATDRMAEIDLPHFCDQAGHIYLGMEAQGAATRHVIRCGQEILDLDF